MSKPYAYIRSADPRNPLQEIASIDHAMQLTHYRTFQERKRLRTILTWTVEFYLSNRDKYEKPTDMQVIDVGCGAGNISIPLASLGYSLTGIDISPESIDYLRAKNNLVNAKFDVHDIEFGPYGTFLYDIAVCSEVLEHLRDPLKALQHIAGMLRPGGLLILTTPNGWGPYEITNCLKQVIRPYVKSMMYKLGLKAQRRHPNHWDPSLSTFNTDTPHLQRFTMNSLRANIQTAGFCITDWENSDFLTFGALSKVTLLARLDCAVANILPSGVVSGWYLRCVRRER